MKFFFEKFMNIKVNLWRSNENKISLWMALKIYFFIILEFKWINIDKIIRKK